MGLILCNLIWSVHPVMGKWLLVDLNSVQSAWIRYASAVCAYFIFAGVMCIRRGFQTKWSSFFLIPKSNQDKFLIFLMGFMAFCFSPLFQMVGLSGSLASENAIIIAIEPLMTAFLAWLVLREKVSSLQLLGFLFALMGFACLAGLGPNHLVRDPQYHLMGNLLILLSLVGESVFSIVGKKISSKYSPLAIFGTVLTTGFVFLTLCFALVLTLVPSTAVNLVDFRDFHRISWKALVAVFWLGPVGTTGCYIYWLHALKELPVMSMALLLFLQPLMGAIGGYLFLGDRLTSWQNFGGCLIFLAVIIPNSVQLKKRSIA